jgi:hypothetical protein
MRPEGQSRTAAERTAGGERRRAVEKLWMTSANPVENLTAKIFLRPKSCQTRGAAGVDAAFAIRFA